MGIQNVRESRAGQLSDGYGVKKPDTPEGVVVSGVSGGIRAGRGITSTLSFANSKKLSPRSPDCLLYRRRHGQGHCGADRLMARVILAWCFLYFSKASSAFSMRASTSVGFIR